MKKNKVSKIIEEIMGIFRFLPRTTRCCCIRNLKTACFLINVYCLMTGLHGIGISVTPSCDLYLTKAADEGNLSVNFLRWCFFVMSLLYLSSNIFFFVGIIVWIKSALEVHILSMFIWTVIGLLLTCQECVLLGKAAAAGGPVCFNVSDIIALLVYFVCNVYFTVVVSSYVEEQQSKY